MIPETIKVPVTCDGCKKVLVLTVPITDLYDEIIVALQERGWRLTVDKDICPKCKKGRK
jgi:hypothetical protein